MILESSGILGYSQGMSFATKPCKPFSPVTSDCVWAAFWAWGVFNSTAYALCWAL